ncbi:Crotonyl-CoA hydratase [Zhongshania aliphaticivorans]|uniref:Crotonyl-CoA hydratase n=1 Tax=Zhongshania aliphaticivorans TaxID=1470434 RepID=A0A5S9Q7X5_9GAMM|nr:crotonase/enoyl-CoA hydratase family protein [Zhongshania aliphaticivorans]CAA0087085.1 Crotonyl-CoA hydratase [Zhongshania aliphaticivorans]CAA0114038.1 Crotonyl-CoA hydratase [Zhongshania aliphaticivorans]
MNSVVPPSYTTVQIRMEEHVAWVALNRPDKANAMNQTMWDEIQLCFEWLDQEPLVRVVVLCGEGRHFCSGIDLAMFSGIAEAQNGLEKSRVVEQFRATILRLQGNLTAIERCRKPVLAAIQGSCVGGGVDIISACDMRYCCDGVKFSIKEIDIGMVADVGTLQRLPHIIPAGVMRELAYTGRNVGASEAERIGLVNRRFDNYEEMIEAVSALAQEISRKSPLAVRGSKQMLLYSRDHSVADALDYQATWNSGMLSFEDVMLAITAASEGKSADFKD